MSDALADRLARRTLALCELRSVYGDERAIADHVEAWAHRLEGGHAVERIGNTVVVGRAHPDRPTVALVGHLDTVPAKENAAAPRIEGERIIGLGASDMKGALAVMLCLLEDLPVQDLPREVITIFYDKEEGPHEHSGLAQVLAGRPDLAQIDLALVMEPTDGVVQVGCLGSLHATVTFRGQAAHSARPWQGENAITRAGAFLARLHKARPHEVEVGGHIFTEVATVTTASGGRYRNIVPEHFALNLNLRFAPGVSLDEAKARATALLEDEPDVEISFTDLAPAGSVPQGNALLDRLVEGGELEIAPKIAWTDVARFAGAGIDAVNFGPGLGAQAHQAGEYVERAALARAYTLLSAFLSS